MGFTHSLCIVVLLQVYYQNVCGQKLPVFRDDYTYVQQTNSFYKFHTERVGWQEAVNTCGKEGATLFFPVNKCEADIVLVHWSKTPAYGWAFIGVSSLSKGVFETIDGRSIWDVYSSWRPGEPNNASGQEKCVVILRDGTLDDVQCDKNFPFICKKKSDSNNRQAICDQVQSNDQPNTKFRKDYQYLENTNSYYKIHTVRQNWRDATEICSKEGAILFYPINKCEVNVILEFWNQTQPFDSVLVGITSLNKGSFQTIDGHQVWEVYNDWRPGEPNNANSNEECVTLNRDGLFNDVRCSLNFAFICKKTGDSNKKNAICDVPETDEQSLVNFRKDYKYLEDTQSVYKIHTIFQNWRDAKVTCEGEGTSLFYPENECEANTVLDFWNRTQPFGWVYIGVYNPTTEATILNFDTIDGRPVWKVYNNWRRGEPNNINGEENCVVLQREGTLNDDRCDKKYAFICKKAISKGNAYCDDIEKSKKFRKDYKYVADTQSFYKLHETFKNWQDAKQTCENEGAFLFYPENTCEADLVLDFWTKMQPSRRIHVGISSPSRGTFETVNGFPTWKAYSKWRPGEPNNEYDVESCVILHRDNMEFSDEKCGKKYPFICKKKLEPRRSGYGCDVLRTNDTSISFRTDYTYLEDTQSLYKMHTIFDNFETAKKICEQEGATLFYPENKCEYSAVSKFWNNTQPATIDTVFIGVKSNKERIFESIDGRRETNMYINWSPNEPNNADDQEYCVIIYRIINMFNDISCDRRFAFTCKKKIDSVDRDAFCDTSVTADNTSLPTDYKYLNDTQSFYKLHKKARNWQDANNVCAKEGATLFYPKNKCEAKAVLDFWTQTESFGWIFIGISSPVEGVFKTIDNKPILDVYNNWRLGEPNNANGEENCVALLRDGTLNDVHCLKNYPFVCKKEQSLAKGRAVCDQSGSDQNKEMTFRKDYTYLSDTQSFYKIHTIEHSWQEAKEICVKEESVLFYPENSCEANVVLEFWNQTQPFSRIFVGIWSPSKGLFQTVNGRPVWQVYNNWSPGEPNNANGKEGCVAFTRDGTYNDVQCSLNFPFICKKKVVSYLNIAICDKPEIDTEQDLSFRKDYKYIKETRSFYKIHTILQPWQDAKEACVKEETKLFYPENELEAKAVLEFMKQTQPFGWIYIGVYNPTKATTAATSNFKTIDGRSVNDVYNKWRDGEPNNANGEENCVTLSLDGTLTDDRCSQNYAFVCKTTIDSIKDSPVKSETETSNQKQDETFRKDYTYFKETLSFYKIHPTFLSWQNAKQMCTKEGAALFYPENKCEANVILNFWNKTQIFRRVFIGVSSPSKTIFETIDGAPIWLVYNNWRPGEPDNANGNEKCVIFNRDGTLNDDKCDAKVPFICKKKLMSTERSSCSKQDLDRFSDEKLLIQKDYTYIENTKSFYKIHTIYQTWYDARKTCVNEGATLFFPENKCETNTIIDFWTRTQPFKDIFLGIFSPVTGSFETIDGRPIWEVYNLWGRGEPSNNQNNEGCVVISRENSLLNDDQCNKTNPFICKKNIETIKGDAICDKSGTDKKRVSYLKDYTYLEDARALYKIHTIFRSWHDAKETCFKEKASLFYPADEKEFKIVLRFWSQTQIYNEIYIGISSTKKGIFNSVNGNQITNIYNKWAPGKPTIANSNEGCVMLRRDGTLDEDYCTTIHPFICKKTQESLNWNIYCDTEDLDYRFNADQKKCYKFHLTPMSWDDAYAACSAENSYLAVINSQAEANFLVKITEEAPKDKVPGNYVSGAVHLGFHKKNGNRWRTATGQSLQESGYDRWGYNQPDGGDQERCGSMFYNGQLNDIGCKQRCFFICEHEINNSSS